MKKILLVTALLAVSWQFTFAENDTIGAMMYPFMDIAPSARAAALADSVCGQAGDPGAAFSNPALLAGITSPQLSLTYGKWFMDAVYQNLSGASNFSFGSLGAQILYLNLGEFEIRDDIGQLLDGEMNSFNISGSVAYAFKPLKKLSAGVSLKVIGQSAAYTSKATAAFDMGVQYEMENVSLGFALNNLGADPLYGFPVTLRTGASSVFDLAKEHKVALGLDAKYVLADELTLSMGAEYSYLRTVFARIGCRLRSGSYQYDVITGVTAGAGLKAGGFLFDYAIVPFGDLGTTHRATVSYIFGEPGETKEKEKPEPEKTAKTKPAEPPEIMKYYNAVIASPKDIKAWIKLARAYDMLGNIRYALTTVEEAMKIEPKNKELMELKKGYKKIIEAGMGTGK